MIIGRNTSRKKARQYIPHEELTNLEWKELMSNCTMRNVKAGETIVAQSEINELFYRIESGCVRVEKTVGLVKFIIIIF